MKIEIEKQSNHEKEFLSLKNKATMRYFDEMQYNLHCSISFTLGKKVDIEIRTHC